MDENATELTQLRLWPDEELPELRQPSQNEGQDMQEVTLEGEQPQTTQLYLPGFEPE